MSIDTLAQNLLECSGFRSRLNDVVADSVASQFAALKRAEGLHDLSHDWNYLLQCASLLAQARTASCEDAALRIAQHCLVQSTHGSLADAACVIFDTLTNKPSIRLAENRKLVEPDPSSRLPLPLRAAWLRREMSHLVVVGDGHELSLNRFQRDVWHATNTTQVLSITAPTSTGKSFLLCQWLAEYFRDNPMAFVVYVVPTRALIQQVESDLRKEFADSQSVLPVINVSSLPMSSSVKADTSNVMVLTQERLHILLLALPPDRRPALMIVDEAHKFGDGARGILLNGVIDALSAESKELKILFASPLVSNPEVLLRGRHASGGVLPRLAALVVEMQAPLFADVVQVFAAQLRHGADACGGVDQRGDDRSVAPSRDGRDVDRINQQSCLWHGDLGCFSFDDAQTLATYGQRRIQHHNVPCDRHVEEQPYRGKMLLAGRDAAGVLIEVFADVTRRDAPKIEAEFMTPAKQSANGVKISPPCVFVGNRPVDEFFPRKPRVVATGFDHRRNLVVVLNYVMLLGSNDVPVAHISPW